MIQAERRQQPPAEPQRKHADDDLGPSKPKLDRPAMPNPLKDRLKKIDPDQAKKYRQRSGE